MAEDNDRIPLGKLLIVTLGVILVLVVLSRLTGGEEDASRSGDSPPSTPPPERAQTPASRSETERTEERVEPTLRITRAEWAGEKVILNGEWSGEPEDLTTCDLLEGEDRGVTDWWDRDTEITFEGGGGAFRKEFVRATDRAVEDPLDPATRYYVTCVGFGDEDSVSETAPVEGVPRPPA